LDNQYEFQRLQSSVQEQKIEYPPLNTSEVIRAPS